MPYPELCKFVRADGVRLLPPSFSRRLFTVELSGRRPREEETRNCPPHEGGGGDGGGVLLLPLPLSRRPRSSTTRVRGRYRTGLEPRARDGPHCLLFAPSSRAWFPKPRLSRSRGTLAGGGTDSRPRYDNLPLTRVFRSSRLSTVKADPRPKLSLSSRLRSAAQPTD